jgi:hypothetical protein
MRGKRNEKILQKETIIIESEIRQSSGWIKSKVVVVVYLSSLVSTVYHYETSIRVI